MLRMAILWKSDSLLYYVLIIKFCIMKIKVIFFLLNLIVGLFVIFGFTTDKKKNKHNEFILIPEGCTRINGKAIAMDSYWIAKYEVSNWQYNEFLNYLKENEKLETYEICKIQNGKWVTELVVSSKNNITIHPIYISI